MFRNPPATLYEKRWKEVAKFSAELVKVLPVLMQCFDADKFISGVDSHSVKFKDLDKVVGKDLRGSAHAAGAADGGAAEASWDACFSLSRRVPCHSS